MAIRVTIGTNADYHVGPNDDAAAAIRSALTAGSRWLVLTGVSDGTNHNLPYKFMSGVNLDDYETPNVAFRLRLEGPGAGLSAIQRATSARLFYSSGSLVADLNSLTFTGITFDGAEFASGNPLCEFRSIDHSYFEDCTFMNSTGDGLSMGVNGHQASAVRFVHCRFIDKAANGLTVLKGIDHTFVGGEARGNGGTGIFWQAADSRGAGVFLGMRFKANVARHLYLVNAYAMRVMNCEFDGGSLIFQGTTDCMFENNYRVNGTLFGGSGIHTQFNNPPFPWT